MNALVKTLLRAVLRMPKLAALVLVAALAALSGTLSYAGYLVVGFVADTLGASRFVAGLLLGLVFARVPWIRQGKLRILGLLPGHARRPAILALLALSMLGAFQQGKMMAMLFLGLAAGFVLGYRWIRQALVQRVFAYLFPAAARPPSRRSGDDAIIDVEFREKKD